MDKGLDLSEEPPCTKLCRILPLLNLGFIYFLTIVIIILKKTTYKSFTNVDYLFKGMCIKSFENKEPWKDKKTCY